MAPVKEKPLGKRIRTSLEQNAMNPSQDFLPEDLIRKYTSAKSVQDTVTEKKLPCCPGCIQFASDRGKRSFLILALIGNLQALHSLHQCGFDDTCLPIGLETRTDSSGELLYEVGKQSEIDLSIGAQRWSAFSEESNWEDNSLEHFKASQWKFLAPVFTHDSLNQTFHESRPLPLVKNLTKRRSGFSSQVTQYRMHVAHQEVETSAPLVAVKQLDKNHVKYFLQESDTLRVISDVDHDHLIKPIATFERGQHYYLIFPWAQGGNLREFWHKMSDDTSGPPRNNKDVVLWFLEQMRGLASAVEKLHGFNCRHGDIKPENILWFHQKNSENLGVLKIADMGLAKVHIKETRSRGVATETITGTLRYEPPECENKIDARSRDFDIWPLGCIYLEFIIWLCQGSDGLSKFNENAKSTPFWSTKNGAPCVHDAVKIAMDTLATQLNLYDKNTTSALADLLSLVRHRLLRVELEGESGPSRRTRARAKELLELTDEIYEKAKSNEAYLNGPSTQKRRASSPSPRGSSRRPDYSQLPSGSAGLFPDSFSFGVDTGRAIAASEYVG